MVITDDNCLLELSHNRASNKEHVVLLMPKTNWENPGGTKGGLRWLTSQNPLHQNPSWLRDALTTRKDPECELLSHVWLFVTPWMVAPPHPPQALLSMEFSRQEYWSGWPCPSPRKDPESDQIWAKQDDWPETTWKLTSITIKPETESGGRAGLLCSCVLLVPWGILPNEIFCFVSTCVSLDNSFPSVRQEPTLRPWKGSLFLQQLSAVDEGYCLHLQYILGLRKVWVCHWSLQADCSPQDRIALVSNMMLQ